MVSLRETILEALSAHGAALRERDALDRRIAAASAEIAPAALGWDVPPARPTDAAWRLEALLAERSRLDASLAGALRAVAASSVPFEIALRVETVVAATRTDDAIGLDRGGPSETVGLELDAIAARVLEVWAPGFDAEALAATFAAGASAVRREVAPPREHATLGWAPVQPDELLARTAAALDGTAFITLTEVARREAAEAEDVAARLAAAEAQVPAMASMLGIGHDAIHRAAELARLLDKEQFEANAAFETAWFAILRAGAVSPPLRLHLALRGASALLGSDGRDLGHALRLDGSLELRRGRVRRALFIAALAEVRAACEAAFPGLGAVASGARGSAEILHAAASGPYRQAGGTAEAGRRPLSSLAGLLDAAGAPAVVARALSHAVVIGVLEQEAGRRGVLDDVVRRSSPSGGDTQDSRARRVLWHHTLLLMHERELVAGCARIELPRTLLHEAIVQVHVAVGWIRAITQIGGGGGMVGQLEALAAIDRLALASGAILGLPSDASSTALAVAARIRGAPGSGAIDALARELRATRFADAVEALPRLARAADELRWRAEDAAHDVSWLDRINVFTRSASEERAEELAGGAAAAAEAVQSTYREATSLLCDAAHRHPAVAVHLGIADVRWGTARIALRWDPMNEVQRLVGQERALEILCAWTRGALAALGPLVPASDILTQYALQTLDARRGFQG